MGLVGNNKVDMPWGPSLSCLSLVDIWLLPPQTLFTRLSSTNARIMVGLWAEEGRNSSFNPQNTALSTQWWNLELSTWLPHTCAGGSLRGSASAGFQVPQQS
jgi:hypothetical protein